MKIASVLALLGACAPPCSSLLSLRNKTSTSWMGTNLYYLQGLSESDQNAYIDSMAEDGAKVVRVWVTDQTEGSCQKGSHIAITVPPLETTIGDYNNETLDVLDKVILKLSKKGIKALISPHDANALLGDYRADVYYNSWGAGYFYELQEAFDAYDARLSYILNYEGAFSGKVWKDWREAIMGFDLQNEPMSPKLSECTDGDQHDWICGRATHMRNELGADNPIIVSSGGIGGDFSHGCTFITNATDCDALDAIAIHRYASVPGNWASSADGWLSQANGKLIYLEEWGINAAIYNQSSAFPSETADMNSVGLPSLYWEIILPHVNACEYSAAQDSGDQFGIVYNSGVDLAGPMEDVTRSAGLQDWTGIV